MTSVCKEFMWTDGWVKSNFSQDSQKVITSIFSPSAKIKICKHSTPNLTISSTHTNQVKTFTYEFVLRPLQFQSTSQNTHLTSITVILAVLAFKKNLTRLHSNQFQSAQLTPNKTTYAFSHSPPGQRVMPTNLHPVLAPRNEAKLHTLPLA